MKLGKRIWFVVLLVIGIVASASIYLAFNANMESVVVATQTINSNKELKASMLTVKKVDKASLPVNYVTADYLEDMVGRYTNIGITEGSVFTTANVVTSDSKKAAVIPEGYTLMSVNIESLPQGVQSGDEVNLMVGINMQDKGKVVMTFQKVLVTSTNVDVDGNVVGIEVQVTPEQAQKIQYAQINGELSVSLLPLGYEEIDLPIVDEQSIQTYSQNYSSSTDDEEVNQSVDENSEDEE